VVIDKFSKWIEARPICSVRSEEAVEFFTDIIYRFGIPNAIIIDNKSNFTGKKFLCFCDDNNIWVDWAAVNHPRTNRQVERANGMILQGLKPHIFKRLEKFKARWVAELPLILWSLRTTPTRGTSYTPFFMVHGSEAVLPTDMDYGSPRVRAYTDEGNQVSLEDAINQLDEARDVALLHSPGTNKRCSVTIATPFEKGLSKSGTWCCAGSRATKTAKSYHHQGRAPFIVDQVLRPGTYKLKDEDGRPITNAWNI
jgi:hypothetical protein